MARRNESPDFIKEIFADSGFLIVWVFALSVALIVFIFVMVYMIS